MRKKILLLFSIVVAIFLINLICDKFFSLLPQYNVLSEDLRGMTQLHWAAGDGRIKDVKFFLEKGADINARDKNSNTPLHKAVFSGHTKTAELLIAKGADINVRDNNGSTPLHTAAFRGHSKIVELLLSAGADANAKNNRGKTPFYYANTVLNDPTVPIEPGNMDNYKACVKLLREHNAE